MKNPHNTYGIEPERICVSPGTHMDSQDDDRGHVPQGDADRLEGDPEAVPGRAGSQHRHLADGATSNAEAAIQTAIQGKDATTHPLSTSADTFRTPTVPAGTLTDADIPLRFRLREVDAAALDAIASGTVARGAFATIQAARLKAELGHAALLHDRQASAGPIVIVLHAPAVIEVSSPPPAPGELRAKRKHRQTRQ